MRPLDLVQFTLLALRRQRFRSIMLLVAVSLGVGAVVVLTARSQVADRVHLLDLGADDYMTKPFDVAELDARCRAVMRRRHGNTQSTIRVGTLTFDAAASTVTAAGQPVDARLIIPEKDSER